ncbi:MAG TPA: autotransporter-associated beta strand repeat-containing protein [Chthoniobacterales bacterium]|jgi:autotransporter-associated beta strand protein|nr:autotransporter-associated beta strand repeat-containing protein [Chthoniobacterales bacterium]
MKTRLFSAAVAALFVSSVHSALAGSATWNLDPASGDWNTAANWTPATIPNDPTDVATFVNSNLTDIFLSAQTHVDSVVFNPASGGFTFNTTGHGLAFFGAGVVNNSANEQNFVTGVRDGGVIEFRNSATAGNGVFTVFGDAFQPYVFFYDTATAGDATFTNFGGFGGAVTWFFNSSTAGNATFHNFSGGNGANDGVTVFEGRSTAGTATIVCDGGGAVFHAHSSAASSTLVANLGNITFLEHATAGEATVIANGGRSGQAGNGTIFFLDGDASAGDASLIATGGHNNGHGGVIAFIGETRGDRARVQVFDNAVLDLTGHSATASMSIGSVEGTGTVALGRNNLTVGRNDLDTAFSGVIEDGAGMGGSLTKTGVGTLILGESNTYTGGTTVENGTLIIDSSAGSGTGTGFVQVNRGTLGGNGMISGLVTIGGDQVNRAILAPGVDEIGLLTIENPLTFASRATYQWEVDTVAMTADKVVAAGVTISDGAIFSVTAAGTAALPIGTVLIVIDNTAAPAISGVFSNLPDGSSMSVGNNTFQANYEGGDGNDLTLTIVP